MTYALLVSKFTEKRGYEPEDNNQLLDFITSEYVRQHISPNEYRASLALLQDTTNKPE
ncbi:MAG: YppF family protein, partial [Bacilli bacterium]